MFSELLQRYVTINTNLFPNIFPVLISCRTQNQQHKLQYLHLSSLMYVYMFAQCAFSTCLLTQHRAM